MLKTSLNDEVSKELRNIENIIKEQEGYISLLKKQRRSCYFSMSNGIISQEEFDNFIVAIRQEISSNNAILTNYISIRAKLLAKQSEYTALSNHKYL